MRRLGRAITLALVGCLLLAPMGCKRKRRRPVVTASADTGLLMTMVQVADPRAEVQLVKGFHGVESGSWRWATHEFSVTLRPPKTAAQNGARLVVKFAVPDVVLQQLKSMTLSAKVNGLDLPPEQYTTPGDKTYIRDVPASALRGDAVTVDFNVDKFLAPTASDRRELAVIVSAVGFEAK